MSYCTYPSVCGNGTEGVSTYESEFLYNWVVGASIKWGIAPYGMSPDGQLQTALNLPTLPLQARMRPSLATCSPIFEQLSGLVSRSTVMEPVGK